MRTPTLSEQLVLAVLDAPKRVDGRLIYKGANHPEYREAKALVRCPTYPELNMQFRASYHVARLPRKYSFMLFIEGERVYALDVAPGRRHFNVRTRKSVAVTHWQKWPTMEAEPDDQELTHHQWFEEFCARANLTFAKPYVPPQFDSGITQRELLGGEDG